MPSFKLAFVALAASLVSAQIDLSQIPTCALSPAVAALGESGCAETDIACICASTSFLNSLLTAVEGVCDTADLCKAETFAKNLCLSVGVTINVPGNACATSAPPPSNSAAPPATTAAPPASSHAAAAGVSTVYVTVPCTTAISSSNPTHNVTVTPTKTAKPSVFTGAAAAGYVSGATMFGGVMAALAMLL